MGHAGHFLDLDGLKRYSRLALWQCWGWEVQGDILEELRPVLLVLDGALLQQMQDASQDICAAATVGQELWCRVRVQFLAVTYHLRRAQE